MLSPGGPSRAPRPSGEASQRCQTPRGTGAPAAQGPRTTSLSPPGIRWDRISPKPGLAEGRCSGGKAGTAAGPAGGGGQVDSHTLSRVGRRLEGWGLRRSQGPLPAVGSSQLPACHRACRKWSVSVQKQKRNLVSE